MNRRLSILSAGILILLAGCSLAPQYQQPKAPVPETWPRTQAYAPLAGSDLPTAQELKWQNFFTDPKLVKIIEMAQASNRDLRLAALNVEKARAMYGIQSARLLPVVNGLAGGAKQGRSGDMIGPGEPKTVEEYRVDLGVAAWEIDFFGRLRSLRGQALESYLAGEQAHSSARILLRAEVARAYLTLAADLENLELARSTLETQQDSYALIEKSHLIGIATEIDLRRAQTQVDAARRDVPLHLQLVAQDRNALNLLAGAPVPENLLPADLNSIVPPQVIRAGLSSEVLLSRPDIMAAEHRLKGAHAFIGAARAALFPRISLTTSLGTASDALSGLFGSGSYTWTFAPQATIPIFDKRALAALEAAKTDRKIILTEYERAIQKAFREVADLLAAQADIDGGGNHVRQGPRVRDGAGHLPQLLGQGGGQLDHLLVLGQQVGRHGPGLFVIHGDIGNQLHTGPEVGRLLGVTTGAEPSHALDHHLDLAVIFLCHFKNHGHGTHGVQLRWGVTPLRALLFGQKKTDDPAAPHGIVHQRGGGPFNGLQGKHHFWKQGDIVHRQNGEFIRNLFGSKSPAGEFI